MDIYDKIDKLLKERHMSRRQLAIAAGIPEASLASAFRRKSPNFPIERINKIAKVLQVSPMSFFSDVQIRVEASPEIFGALQEKIAERYNCLSSLLLSGDNVQDADDLLQTFTQLNDVGKKRLLDYANDIESIPKYCKTAEEKFPGL